MDNLKITLIIFTFLFTLPAWAWSPESFTKPTDQVIKSKLTDIQYKVTQIDDTETPFKNKYWDNKKPGIYVDIISGEPLFSSTDKFKSGTGWPSFTKPLVKKHINYKEDKKLFRTRTEVRSKYADSHLGHVFDDGPKPSGKRYCINSAALRFIPLKNLKKEGYGVYLSLFTKKTPRGKPLAKAYFAGGCFWCMEPPFEKEKGVVSVDSGYSGGKKENPTYKQVSSGQTQHIEAIEVTYKPDQVSYSRLLEIFVRQIDPTQANGQFVDKGPQYRSAIFYANDKELKLSQAALKKLSSYEYFKNKKIVTELIPFKKFYKAEGYHQDYYKKNPIRYKFYRLNSGRDSFLKKAWLKNK